jgi:putative effector of murein hydrolase
LKRILLIITFILSTTQFMGQDFRERDKQLHFAAGSIIGAFGYHMYQKEFGKVPQSYSILAGLATGFAAGTAKELFDTAIQGEKFDSGDLAATVLGSFTIAVTIPLFQNRKVRYRQLDKVKGGYKY